MPWIALATTSRPPLRCRLHCFGVTPPGVSSVNLLRRHFALALLDLWSRLDHKRYMSVEPISDQPSGGVYGRVVSWELTLVANQEELARAVARARAVFGEQSGAAPRGAKANVEIDRSATTGPQDE